MFTSRYNGNLVENLTGRPFLDSSSPLSSPCCFRQSQTPFLLPILDLINPRMLWSCANSLAVYVSPHAMQTQEIVIQHEQLTGLLS